MLWNSGGGVTAKTCSAGDFFTAVDGSGNFTCSTASGSGDVTAVGDCASGACFDGTSGNSIQFEGSTADAFETTLTATDPTADRTITMPNRTGQMALEKVVNLYDYAACDGTNEATGIQAAITAACALGPGGTLYVPADTCVYGSTLTLCSGLAIVGSDSTERVAYPTAQPHELSYSGTGTAIDAQSLSGVRLSGLLLRATSGSFAGPLVDADGTGYLYIERVMMTAATQAGAATCALLSLNNATDVSVDGSAFYRCGYAIKGRALSSDFSNVVRLNHNAFYEAEACSVQNIGDAWEFTNNKWQQQGATDNESDLICHGGGICSEGVTFTGNMSVDQPSGPTNGQFIFCGSGVSISGNYIGGNTTQDGVLFDEQCDGCSVQGNWFGFLDEAVKFSGTGSSASNGVIVLGNDYDTVTTKVGGTRPGGSVMQENTGGYIVNETGDIWLNVDTDANSGAGTMVIGSNLTSTSATHQFDFTEAYAQFRRGNDLRFYDADDSNYVEATVGTVNITSNKTLTIPDATGTMCVSAAAPLTLNATTGDLTTTADPVSIKGVAVTDTSGVDFVEGTGITITSNTGVSPDTATLAATLGTAIDTSEITDGTIAFADVNSTQTLAGNPANGASSVWFGTTGLIWEGATSDNFETLLVAADTTASDKTITLPNETGTVCTTGSICSGTVQYQAGLAGGDVTTSSGGAAATIGADKVLESMLKVVDTPADEECLTYEATGGDFEWQACGSGAGDSITVNTSAATDPDFANGDIDWTLTGGNSITATVACSGCVDSTDLADSISATTFTGALVGNADTATALAANPSDCASDTYATTIAASGNLTCATVTNAGLAGSIAMSKTLLTADAGVALSTNSLTTASDEQNFLASGALTCGASTNGKMQVHTTPLQYCDNAATPTLQYAAYANSTGQATALNTGAGSDGSRGITFTDNTSNPSAPSSGETILHSKASLLYSLADDDTSPGGFLVPTQSFVRTSNYTNATTSLTDVFGSSANLANAGGYIISGHFQYSTSAATTDFGLAFDLSAATSAVISVSAVCQDSTANNADFGVATADATAVTIADAAGAVTDGSCIVNGYIKNGTSTGTLTIRAKAIGAGTLTISAGSNIVVQRVS